MAATIKDIARETGLSLATISKYLNGGNLREKNRVAIEAAIKKLDYQVNEYARGLKSKKSRTVGDVLPQLADLFNMKIVSVIERVLQENGYSIILCDCQSSVEQEARCVQFLMKKQVDGIINIPLGTESSHLLPALEREIPILLLDRPLEDLNGKVSCVLIDNRGAARMAVRRLLDAGHRKIGIVVGPQEFYTAEMRLRGYREALEEYGVPVDQRFIARGGLSVEGGYRQVRRLLKENQDMTAVFVTNYEMTLGALIALNKHGVQIPQELSIVGFDNIMDLSRVFRPQLTIVSQPMDQIGMQAARLMLERLSGDPSTTPMTVTLSASLREGGSVQAPRGK